MVPTTTSEPPNIAYLTRSWDNLAKLKITFGVAWRVITLWWFGGCGGAAADRHMHLDVKRDAGSNHHFRAAKHRVLDTLLGQSKLRITLGGRVES